jgi:hypothetical protein
LKDEVVILRVNELVGSHHPEFPSVDRIPTGLEESHNGLENRGEVVGERKVNIFTFTVVWVRSGDVSEGNRRNDFGLVQNVLRARREQVVNGIVTVRESRTDEEIKLIVLLTPSPVAPTQFLQYDAREVRIGTCLWRNTYFESYLYGTETVWMGIK